MKIRYKLIALGLLAVMCTSFAACGKDSKPENDYGTLSIEDVKVYIANGKTSNEKYYTFAEIEPVFTKPDKAETLTFTYDTTKLKIENNVVTPTARTNATYPVTAKSDHFKENFNVEVVYLRWEETQFDTTNFSGGIAASKEKCQAVNAKTTLFLGDSFMSDDYIRDYMADYSANKEVINAGISRTTSYHWEREHKNIIGNVAPKNIVFHIGTNNFYDPPHDSAEDAEASLCRLMMFLHMNYPTSKIWWFNITQRRDPTYAEQVTETNTYMANWCAKYDWVTCVDTCSQITVEMLQGDGTHPQKNTYEKFTTALTGAGCVIESK